MQQRLNQLWYGARAPLALLAPFGWLYGAAVAARRRAYAAGLDEQAVNALFTSVHQQTRNEEVA